MSQGMHRAWHIAPTARAPSPGLVLGWSWAGFGMVGTTHMSGTEEAAVVAARRLADTCAAILNPTLVAAILHGSLTMDAFRPGTSALDLLLVVEQGLRPRHAHALVDAVRAADVGPAGGIDLL